MIRTRPGTTIEWLIPAPTGLQGTLAWRVDDGTNTTVDGPHTADVIELGATGRYIATITAPDTRGVYVLLASTDGSFDEATVYADQLEVTYTLDDPAGPTGRDLCTLQDVLNLLPGYRQSDTVEAKLQELITEESEKIQELREIAPAFDQPEERDFDIDHVAQMSGEIRIGDLATVEGLAAEIRTAAGATVRTIETADITPLYRFGRRQPRAAWEPVVALRIRPNLPCNRVLHLTGTFGFPSIPPHIRQATAKRVLLRYVSDVASTQIIDAVDTLNLAAMFASARDAVDSLNDGVYIS